MVEIHIFGKLRRYAKKTDGENDDVIRIAPRDNETIGSLLAHAGITTEEIYTIFINHKLLAARSGMARWVGHQQVRSDPFDWNLDIAVNAGDRIGLFGRDMAALVI